MSNVLRDIVKRVGGDIYAGGNAAMVPGPGHSRNDRSLSLRLTGDGRVLFYSHANDSLDLCFGHLGLDKDRARRADPRELADLRRAAERERREQRARDQAFCQDIWSGTQPLEGSPAEAYLWSRGLIIEGCADLRFHPAAPRTKDRDKVVPPCPAMAAVVRDRDGGSMSLHLTYLKPDGSGKAFGNKSRLMFGPMRGGTVHLTPPGQTLALGEGIETCAAYGALKGLPVWAALTTSQYATFQLPRGVRRLVICADGDKGGLNAARLLAERMSRLCNVEIDPAPDGQDWADVWERRHV